MRVRPQTRRGRVGQGLETALLVFGSVIVVLMVLYSVVNALSRTLFNVPVPATLEIVQFLLMPALGTVGLVAATRARRHVSADILFGLFPPAGRKWLAFGTLVLSALTFAVLVWFTWQYAVFALDRNFKAGFTSVASWPLYFFVPVALGASAVLFARDAWRQARAPSEEDRAADDSRWAVQEDDS